MNYCPYESKGGNTVLSNIAKIWVNRFRTRILDCCLWTRRQVFRNQGHLHNFSILHWNYIAVQFFTDFFHSVFKTEGWHISWSYFFWMLKCAISIICMQNKLRASSIAAIRCFPTNAFIFSPQNSALWLCYRKRNAGLPVVNVQNDML